MTLKDFIDRMYNLMYIQVREGTKILWSGVCGDNIYDDDDFKAIEEREVRMFEMQFDVTTLIIYLEVEYI